MKTKFAWVLGFVLLSLPPELPAQGDFQSRLYQARDKVLPALVHVEPIISIYTSGEKQHTVVTGSGVIFSNAGYVLTNHHVVENAEKVWCTLSNKERITAVVVGSDPSTDIAVLQLNLDELNDDSFEIPRATLGNSDSLQVGQIVLALGSPLGLSRSVSMGVISSIDRYFPDQGSMISPYNLWIQTDAAINPGNSGGPLINLEGEVIGINARGVFLAENLGFAIPINLAREVARKIIEGRTVKRAWVGIEIQDIKGLREYLGKPDFKGVLLAQVDPRSPAERAGLQPGDIILQIGSQTVHAEFEEDLPPVRKIIADLPIGEKIPFRIWRKGNIRTIPVETREEPFKRGSEFEARAWGLVVKNIDPDVYRVQMLSDFFGVYVTGVKSGAAADQAHIRNGDVIRKMNGQLVKDVETFKNLFAQWVQEPTVFVELIRNGYPYFTIIKTENLP